MEKKALMIASVASMIDLFNTDNINILRSLGYSVEVATNFEEGSITSLERVYEYKNELKKQGIITYQVPIPRSIKKIGDIILSYKYIKNIVCKNKYQIVHCHSPIGGVICRVACRIAKKKYGTKVIYTAHGFHFFEGSSKLSWLLYYPLEKWCSKFTDVLITINKEDYKNAIKMNAKKVEYVPGIGIHTDEIKDLVVDKKLIRSEFGFSDNDFIFMSSGQISIRKNHEVVIKALANINNKNIKYLIVGLGEEKNKLVQLVEQLELKNRVVFAGYRKDVKKILHAVDCFVFPSLQEGLPVALMEAMCVGLPVVCSRIRGNIDLVEDGKGGYLYDPRDVKGFTDGMIKIYNLNSKYMGKINQEVIKNFDIKIVNEKMKKVYLEILE